MLSDILRGGLLTGCEALVLEADHSLQLLLQSLAG